MTTIAEDVAAFLIADATVTGLVGSRVHYNHVPQGSSRPHIWFRTSRDVQERTLDKVGGLHESAFDVECIAATEAAAQGLADAVVDRLDGYKGSLNNSTAQGVFLDNKDDTYVPRGNQSDEGLSVVAFEMSCWYTT